MDKLYTNIASLLSTKARLIEYTELTQNEIGKENVVLWNRKPLSIENVTYNEFKVALKKRPCKYYMYNNKVSYTDFCIALICCIEYSLNSKVTVGIEDKTFTAAWRAIEVMSTTSTDRVCLWIKEHIADRSAIGYCNSLGITLDNISLSTNISYNTLSINNITDRELVDNILNTTNTIVKIQYYGEDEDNINNNGKVWRTTQSPEAQLYDLQLAHDEFNNSIL